MTNARFHTWSKTATTAWSRSFGITFPAVIIILLLANLFWLAAVEAASDSQDTRTTRPRVLSIEECVRAALEMNPGIEAASYRIRSARAAHRKSRASWYPHISASGGYERTDNPAQAFIMELNQRRFDLGDPDLDPSDPDHTQNIRLSLNARYLLYDGGQSRLGEDAAQKRIEVADHELAARRNELVYEVRRGYYNALRAREMISVYRQAEAQIEKSLELARNRFKEGTVLKTDVLNLEVQLARAEEDLLQAENAFRLAVAALNTSIGADIVTPENLVSPSRQEPAGLPANPESLSVAERPELLRAAAYARAARLDARSTRRAYRPNVEAFGSMDMDSKKASRFEESYRVGVAAEWDIFDGHARSAARSEASAHRREALAVLKETRKQLELDLEDARLTAQNASKRREVTRRALDRAEESLRTTQSLYENGAVDVTALLSAQTAMTRSMVRHQAARYEYLEALANLDRAAARTWPA